MDTHPGFLVQAPWGGRRLQRPSAALRRMPRDQGQKRQQNILKILVGLFCKAVELRMYACIA